tara:strand:+ start:47 stop:295 length:249 start_codon:yes stop_codon:yes gene_type:complete
LKILYFAKLKQLLGKNEDFIKVDKEVTVREIIEELKKINEQNKKAFSDVKNLQYAINCEYVSLDTKVNDKDELALFPPVTGG